MGILGVGKNGLGRWQAADISSSRLVYFGHCGALLHGFFIVFTSLLERRMGVMLCSSPSRGGKREMSHSSGHCTPGRTRFGRQGCFGSRGQWIFPVCVTLCRRTRAKQVAAVRSNKIKDCSRQELLDVEFTSRAKCHST